MVFPHGRPVSGQVVVLSCQRAAHLRGRLGALLLIAQITCSLRGPVAGRRNSEWEALQTSFCLTMNSLRSPRNDAAVNAESVLGTRALCKLVAAARNPRFGAKPGSAVRMRRRRNMNCYFHSSTVCRMRRETSRIFFCNQDINPVTT